MKHILKLNIHITQILIFIRWKKTTINTFQPNYLQSIYISLLFIQTMNP